MKLPVDVGRVIDVGAAAKPSEPTPQAERRIDAWLWYPAAGAPAPARDLAREIHGHPWRPLPSSPLRVAVPSVATPDAPLHGEGRLPVVVLSHGLLNWATAMNYLAEHLATRGYAVLGLEHEDERAADPLRAALYLRPLDQGSAIRTLERLNESPGHVLHRRLAMDRVALVGYSMGAYGALVSAGARVAQDGMAYGHVPGGALERHARPMQEADARVREQIGAVVAIAPWGGQSAIGALKAAGLAGVTAATFVIAGDQDDISGYADGVRSIWDGLVAAQRWLLVYENARHNIGANGAPPALHGSFASWTSFEEPVWRRDRILDVNRHFITAFLDHSMRGQDDRKIFLTPAVTRASEGAWPQPWGTPATGQFAGAPQGPITQWAGFQRRWAVGLQLEARPPGAGRP